MGVTFPSLSGKMIRMIGIERTARKEGFITRRLRVKLTVKHHSLGCLKELSHISTSQTSKVYNFNHMIP